MYPPSIITANVRPPSASTDFFNFSETRACSLLIGDSGTRGSSRCCSRSILRRTFRPLLPPSSRCGEELHSCPICGRFLYPELHRDHRVRRFNLVLFASTTVSCAGRPATRYRAAREPLPCVPFPACRQLSRARNACAGSSSEESTKLKHASCSGRNSQTRSKLLLRSTGFAR